MLKSVHKGIKISGIAAAVSNDWKSTEECAKKLGTDSDFNVKKFIKNTGVEGRYFCGKNQTPSDFCYAAAKKIIEEKNVNPEDIGVVVYVTQSPDYRSPATACVLQERLGINTSSIAFDLNMGCSGFLIGLNTTASLLSNSNAKKALLMCGDLTAQDMNRDGETDSQYYLFGDGGAAILLDKDESSEDEMMILTCTDGKGLPVISSPGKLWRHTEWKFGNAMDGEGVFSFAIDKAPEMLNEYMKLQGKTPEDYDKLVLHQANLFIMKQVARRTGFPSEKMSVSINKFGNTSSVSIPLSIVNDYGESNGLSESRKLLCCGFGVGLSWAAVDFEVNEDCILPIIHTDEWFDDGLDESVIS